jgi:hypothetical protein
MVDDTRTRQVLMALSTLETAAAGTQDMEDIGWEEMEEHVGAEEMGEVEEVEEAVVMEEDVDKG